MHIAMENVVVEVIDGEIVVTNLYSQSFPIIRYKLGDSVKLADSDFKCKCGRAHPVITDILGRVGKKIAGKESSYPSLTLYYLFKNLGLTKNILLNYQAIQKGIGYGILTKTHKEWLKYKPKPKEIAFPRQLRTANLFLELLKHDNIR
jgi:phenylacetate-CoA ligase